MKFIIDNRLNDDYVKNMVEFIYILFEKFKRGFLLNKNIFIRNIMVYIVNMFVNENIGFKSEYYVW